MPSAHVMFFTSLLPYYRTDDAIFVHAGLDETIPLEDQSADVLMFGWDDGRFPDRYMGREVVVYGHRNNPVIDAHGWPLPRHIGRTIGLDTSHYGVVTALRLPDERLYQSDQYLANSAPDLNGPRPLSDVSTGGGVNVMRATPSGAARRQEPITAAAYTSHRSVVVGTSRPLVATTPDG